MAIEQNGYKYSPVGKFWSKYHTSLRRIAKFPYPLLGYERKLMLLKGILPKSIGLLVCSLLPILLPIFASAEAEYYTWVDENGVTNYAQKNPQGYDADHVSKSRPFGYQNSRRPQGDPATTTDTESNEGTKNEDPTSLDDERKAIAEQIAAVKKSNCNLGKRNLAQLEAYSRIRVKDAEGNETLLNEEEKAARINEARQIIQENCTG
jgi:hypothetical protein